MPGHSNKKQTQRTKGNLRPSSSSHAAQLLTSGAVGGQPGLLMFGQTPQYVPASSLLEDMDSSLDSDFRMVLRKLTKKDATTKIKGLQEFSALCKEKSEDCVKAVLPFWPRTYNKIALDVNYRVREAAQNAMSVLVLRVRRNFAPYLKNLMGAWLLSQCDTYPTVASAAEQAFKDAFPPAKQTEALSFCMDSVMEYMTENLVKHIPQSLSDPKTTDPDDMENKYNRVLAASLLAIRKLLVSLPANQMEALKTSLTTLLSEAKFWKHAKSKVGSVKGAVYSCLAALCQYQPELCALYVEKMTPVILHNLDEQDTAVCSQLWEAVLSLIKYVPDCWKYVNVQKAFWPKLKVVLETGCHGNATCVGPNLLPLVSHIPCDLFPDISKFYEDFFSTLRNWLSSPQVNKSQIESHAVVKAFMECAIYIIKKNVTTDITARLVLNQVKPVVEVSLLEPKSPLYSSYLYGMLGNLLTSLETLDNENSKQTASQFWSQLKDTIQPVVTSPEQPCDKIYTRLVLLSKALYYPESIAKQVTSKVKFGDVIEFGDKVESDNKNISSVSKKFQAVRVEPGSSAREFVQFLCLTAFAEAHKNVKLTHLQLFADILSLDPSEETVAMVISRCQGDSASEISQTNSHYFVFKICLPWLRKFDKTESTHIGYMQKIVCTFLPVLDKESVLAVLDELFQACVGTWSESSLLEQLIPSSASNSVVREWLQSASLGDKFVSRVQAACHKSDELSSAETDAEIDSCLHVLNLLLKSGREGKEQFLARKYIEAIIETMLQALSAYPKTSESCLSFVARALSEFLSLYEEFLQMPSAVDLIVNAFLISVKGSCDCSGDTVELLRKGWLEGVAHTVCQTGGYLGNEGVLSKLAAAVQTFVSVELDKEEMLQSLQFNVDLLLTRLETSLPAGDTESGSPLNPVFIEYWTMLQVPLSQPVPTMVWVNLCLKGDYPGIPTVCDDSRFPMKTLIISFYNFQLLHNIRHRLETHDSNEESKEVKGSATQVELPGVCIDALADCFQGMAIVRESSSAEDLRAVPLLQQSKLNFSVNSLSARSRGLLIQQAFNRFDSNSDYCLAIRHLLDTAISEGSCKFDLDLNMLLDRVVTLTEVNVYVLVGTLKHLTDADLVTLTEIFVARLLTVAMETVASVDGGTGLLCVLSQLIRASRDPSSISELVISTLDQVNAWREEREDLLLFSCTLSEHSAVLVELNTQLARFLAAIVDICPSRLSDKHWDFIMCSLVSWINTLEESQQDLLDSPVAQGFVVGVFNLLEAATHCFKNVIPMETGPYPPNLLTEWVEFFSEPIYSAVLPIVIMLCKKMLTLHDRCRMRLIVGSLSGALRNIPGQFVLEHKLPPLLVAGELTPLPDTLQSLLNHMCPLLAVNEREVQVMAFFVLNSIIGSLPEYEREEKSVLEGASTGASEEEENSSRSPPSRLMKVVDESSLVMEEALLETPIGTRCDIGVMSPEYNSALAYLLSWKLLLAFFKSAPQQLRQEYACYLQEGGYIDHLMCSLFRLMPTYPDTKFQEPITLSGKGHEDLVRELDDLSCDVYRLSLLTMPAMVRYWWKEQDRKTSATVDMFTTKYVSSHLCKAELQTVQQSDLQLENMSVKARPSTREVIATYTLEEVSIEMVISLPPNYPLGNIQVVSEKRVGVSGPQWEKWLLQLNIFLQHQNGNIMDGLKLWKNNIDKRFEGVDECMICFYVLHGTNFQLPKITCRTCKKKYHSICLYKWFKTSNNCTCPLCRNVF